MKVLVLAILMPLVARAGDSCTDPDKYTIDKRCYVTDEQKKEKPYNAVVKIYGNYDIVCTGTIIKYDGHFYVYTAKHCTDNETNGVVDKSLLVGLQDGRGRSVILNRTGNYDISADTGFSGDWAIYQFHEEDDEEDIPSVDFSNNIAWGFDNRKYDARVIGYGSLKIMSDVEIENFKRSYIDWLKARNPDVPEEVFVSEGLKKYFGFTSDGGIDLLSTPGKVYHKMKRSDDIFRDKQNLKVSHCKYTSSGRREHCQVWGGNSGGGVFDVSGNLMAITTRANSVIGGSVHADGGIGDAKRQIDLLDSPEQIFFIKPSEIKNPSFIKNGKHWHPPLL